MLKHLSSGIGERDMNIKPADKTIKELVAPERSNFENKKEYFGIVQSLNQRFCWRKKYDTCSNSNTLICHSYSFKFTQKHIFS